MSIDPSSALLASYEETLRTNAGVKSEFGGTTRLYTLSAPNSAPYNYLIIGEFQVLPGVTDDCATSSHIFAKVHIWVREAKPALTRQKQMSLSGAVREALDQELNLTGHDIDDFGFVSTDHLTDTDGLTGHSVLTFEYFTTAAG